MSEGVDKVTIKAPARFRFRGDTAEGWADKNPVLKEREPALLLDENGKTIGFKVGDGKTAWNELPLCESGSGLGVHVGPEPPEDENISIWIDTGEEGVFLFDIDDEEESGGTGFIKAEINDAGELVFTYSDGTTENLGVVVGADGKDGANGSDGADGKDGTDGQDGVSCTHSWDGTTLTVTSASGTSSVDLKGDKGDTGTQGEKGEQGVQGIQGEKGTDGYTPVKGVDYWTDVEKAAIVAEVIDSVKVEYPEAHVIYGDVDSDNNIIIHGELPEGTYTLKYENEDGTIVDVGDFEIGNIEPVNQIPISTDTDGSIYNEIGYMEKRRINSSGEVDTLSASGDTATNPIFVTGFIPVKNGDVVRLKNCFIDTNNVENHTIYGQNGWSIQNGFYDSSKTKLGLQVWTNTASGNYTTATADANGHVTEFAIVGASVGYMRLCLAPTSDPADAIVTVNQKID